MAEEFIKRGALISEFKRLTLGENSLTNEYLETGYMPLMDFAALEKGKRVMVKQMVFKTEHNTNNQKVYICPFCGRSWRKLVNAIACYEQCEQKPLNTLKN